MNKTLVFVETFNDVQNILESPFLKKKVKTYELYLRNPAIQKAKQATNENQRIEKNFSFG